MKNNYLLGAMLLGAVAFFSSCEPKDNADPVEIANEMSVEKFEATATRSQVTVTDGVMRIKQWDFTDKTPKTLAYTYAEWGPGVATLITTPIEYEYTRLGLAENNLGVNYIFTRVDDPTDVKQVLYWGNGFIVDGDSIVEAGDKLANFSLVIENFPNHEWLYEGKADSLAIDTLLWDSVYTKNVKYWDEQEQKYKIRKDTIVDTIAHIVKTVLGPASYKAIRYEFTRDGSTNANAYNYIQYDSIYLYNSVVRHLDSTLVSKLGHDYYTYKVSYDVDRQPAQYQLVETCVTEGLWSINSITSSSRFALTGTALYRVLTEGRYVDEEETRNISISAFSLDKKSTKIGNYEFKLLQ